MNKMNEFHKLKSNVLEFKITLRLLNFLDNSCGIFGMHHKKVKTEPCLSPESPFMRKPSKEFLQKLTLNKAKPKVQEKNMLKSSEYFNQENISKISFIPRVSNANIESLKGDSMKLKKTTIDVEKFRIKHENLLLKTQREEILRKNTELVDQNRALKKQISQLRKQLQGGSRISKFSSETLEHTDQGDLRKRNTLVSLGSHESLLEMQSYEILSGVMEISQVNSLVFDDELRPYEDGNFLSTSIGKKSKTNNPNKQHQKSGQQYSYKQEIEILNNRICCLEKELQNSLLREKQLSENNKKLMLSVSMSQRKLQLKDSELKEMRIREKKKNYFEKLYELSSEDENQIH